MTRERWFAAATFGVLGIVLVAWLWPLLVGETLFWGLPSLQFYPWRSLAFAQVRAGELPLWNPYNGGGVPLLANYQTAVFYPPNYLHLLLPDITAMNVLAVGHVIWAGVGMWRFAGVLGLPALGSGISVLAFALNGYIIGRLGSFPTVAAVAWMPWLFVAVHRLVRGRSARDVVRLGLVSAMLLLAGHAQTAFYVLLAGGAYALWLAVRRPGPLRALGLAAGGVGLGAGLAAIQLLPTAELLGRSARSNGLGYEWTTNFSYSLARALTLIVPNLYGTPADGSYLTEGAYFEDAAYPGLLTVIAAFFAVVMWLRRRRVNAALPTPVATVPFWVGMGLLAFLIALGKNGFLFPLLYDTVPTFRSFQGPVRWLVLLAFALALLAGIGVSYAWGRGKWTIFWSRLALAGGLGLAIIAGIAAPRLLDTDTVVMQVMQRALLTTGLLAAACAGLTLLQPEPGAGRRVMIWRVAAIMLLGADLFWAFRGLNPTVPNAFFAPQENAAASAGEWLYQPEATVDALVFDAYFTFKDYRVAVQRQAELRAALLPNMNIIDGVYLYNNFDPIDTQAHTEAVRALEARLPAEPDGPIILAEDETPAQTPFGLRAVQLGAGITLLSGGMGVALWWLGGQRRPADQAADPGE